MITDMPQAPSNTFFFNSYFKLFMWNSNDIKIVKYSLNYLIFFYFSDKALLLLLLLLLLLCYFLGAFHISISWWSFTWVWETKSLLKSPEISSILANLNNAVVWMVSTHSFISKSSSPCINPLVTVPRAPITIGIIVTFHIIIVVVIVVVSSSSM